MTVLIETTDQVTSLISAVGITARVISSVATSQTAGSAVTTDYVYNITAGIALTLPTAVASINIYTLKNSSSSSVLIATTSAQTIDGQANMILNKQYTSISLISDGLNWTII